MSVAMPIVSFAGSAIAVAIRELYKISVEINDWMDGHIQEMQASDNLTISRTGRILEAAKTGFGLGYVVSVTVIAVGQLLLGNQLQAVGTIASAAVLANPMAMTCAAVGAIIYGWGALSKKEQQDVLDRISSGLGIGIELIKSMVNFIISTSKEVMNSKNVDELKEILREKAAVFGTMLGTITRRPMDILQDLTILTKDKTSEASERLKETLKNALDQNGDGALSRDDVTELYKKISTVFPWKGKGADQELPDHPSETRAS